MKLTVGANKIKKTNTHIKLNVFFPFFYLYNLEYNNTAIREEKAAIIANSLLFF